MPRRGEHHLVPLVAASHLLLLVGCVGATETPLPLPGSTCGDALNKFLDDLRPLYNSEDNSLVLQGVDNYDFIQTCGTQNFSLELWRAIQSPRTSLPKDFGSKDYFSKYQNCDSPNPDLLWKHGDSIRATVTNTAADGSSSSGGGGTDDTLVSSSGVGGGGASSASGGGFMTGRRHRLANAVTTKRIVFYHVVEHRYMLRVCPCSAPDNSPCTCEHAGPGAAVCSEIFNMSNPSREQVFPWCRVDGHPSPKPQLSAPKLQHCPAQVMVSGTLPSCTPVRSYDQVEVVLQPMASEVDDCKELPREGIGRLEQLAPLTAINATHGVFHVVIGNITHDTYYCLRVELVNHPYCNSGSDHTLTRQSSVCRAVSLKKPIFIEDHVCGRPDPCEAPKPNLPLITGASLAAALLLAVGLVLSHRLACRRQASREADRGGRDTNQRLLLAPAPNLHHPDVFFLYWGDNLDFIEVNRLVVRWLTGLGHRVIDLNDELLQEELISCPESWITDKLDDPSVKVIVVDSELANECLLSTTVDVVSGGGGGVYGSSSERGMTIEDVARSGGGMEGLGSSNNRDGGGVTEATGLVRRRSAMDDLRAYSLRHIQAQLAANYRRLGVVQYRKEGIKGPIKTSLVPHTRHSLPEHLAELQAWLADTHGWDDNCNSMESAREQTLRDLKAAVQRYTAAHHSLNKYSASPTNPT